jgi:ATPase subunit of ABC transporter with duplicated ATPase domains
LEQTLAQFPGTILCVSHDRYFLDRTVNRLLVLDPPGMVDFEGNYSAWMTKQRTPIVEEKSRQRDKRPIVAPKPQAKKSSNPLSRLRPAELEEQIAEAEAAVSAARTNLGDPLIFRDPQKARAAQSEHDRLEAKLRKLEEEYFSREKSD